MNSTPSLSIIVPAYNVQNYIDACIASILAQLQPHHELIVIDDGSSDATGVRLAALRASHDGANFSVTHQPNQGISATRNHGVAAARGDYIAFVDSDDVLLPGALAAIDREIAGQPDVIACDFRMWHPDSPAKSYTVRCGYQPGVTITDRDLILQVFFADSDMYVWSKIFKRHIYMRHDMPLFPVGRVFEDVTVVPQLLASCASLVYLPQAIIDYRQHPVSITAAVSEKWCLDFAAALHAVKRRLTPQLPAASVRLQFDVAACDFYIGVVKNSYQLPLSTGSRVRKAVKACLLDSLFHEAPQVMAALRQGMPMSKNVQADRRLAKQLNAALSGSLGFHLAQSINRKLKYWRRLRQIRVQAREQQS
ncbi:glycosyltransferase family 2 protein [Janthinobacterium agaricidamnosum]|uniref:Glycosyl transferase 2 family protein n=1 Tax=Janthinobacterium agaricidamnosum NBRC 102515 = DSM 9628 TaxID=1349767 RepID=W0V157_9BURK|nr:glycosyltransferase family A protein [Janthinobacterium agaricidamnosum]CDG81606.1 glycosyl transferase 2 family protein [Janthinobacterium agaricidamnosum NBRC 102515 = DSM 9628]